MVAARAMHRAAALWLALVADRVLTEPPPAVHPVARFGQAMTGLERAMWADRRGRGVAYAAAGVGGATAVGSLLPLCSAMTTRLPHCQSNARLRQA